MLVLAASFVTGGLLLSSSWIAMRGVKIVQSVCAWNEARGAHIATITVQNREPVFKLVSLRVRGHFRPGRSQQWQHDLIRRQYENMSRASSVFLTPEAVADGQVQFDLPGGNQYVCQATAQVSRQARFVERPSADVVKTITAQFEAGK